MAVKPLVKQAGWHFFGRIVSSLFSFVLFALIGSRLPVSEAQEALYFLFSLGFWLTFLRLFIQLSSGISGKDRATVRMQAARRGFGDQLRAFVLILPIMAVMFWGHLHNLLFTIFALGCVGLGMIDGDLIRSIVKQSSMFSRTFGLGSILSVALFILAGEASRELAVICILVQWAPTVIFNLKVLPRLFQKGSLGLYKIRGIKTNGLGYSMSMALLASFDGIILNAPFFGLVQQSPDVGIDIALAVRIFVASIAIYPLLLHWMNSRAMHSLSAHISMSTSSLFTLLIWAFGCVSGLAFIGIFRLIEHDWPSASAVMGFFLLLGGFGYYAASMRLSGPVISQRFRTSVILIAVAGFAGALLVLNRIGTNLVVITALLQAAVFVAMGLAIRRQAERQSF